MDIIEKIRAENVKEDDDVNDHEGNDNYDAISRVVLVGYIGVALRTHRREGVGEARAGPGGRRRRGSEARRAPPVWHPTEHLHRLQAAGCRLHDDAADCSWGTNQEQ